MQIKITKINKYYGADLQDLPGSPPIGVGETPEQAVANLFYSILCPNRGSTNWVHYIDWRTCGVIE